MDNRRLNVQAGMAKVYSAFERSDMDGTWIDIIGDCARTRNCVRRAIFTNGDVLEYCTRSGGWIFVDMGRRYVQQQAPGGLRASS